MATGQFPLCVLKLWETFFVETEEWHVFAVVNIVIIYSFWRRWFPFTATKSWSTNLSNDQANLANKIHLHHVHRQVIYWGLHSIISVLIFSPIHNFNKVMSRQYTSSNYRYSINYPSGIFWKHQRPPQMRDWEFGIDLRLRWHGKLI